MTPLRAGLVYAALAFLAGMALGPVRELALAPRIGGLPAALAEATAMAALLWVMARAVMARLAPPPSASRRAVVAAVALAVVLALEAALGAVFEATGLAATRAPRGGAERAVGLALLAWLAVLPFLVRRHARALP
ncbi:hypothetical protein [Roseomonas sp. HF4]|uniref:hypothetical protein n=1 Tax=Roseomonas sp. HF4 TaxID=2562313 RepID=UPI0010C07746|nr:hypothetical protein [Roseomonas sp. HF4]